MTATVLVDLLLFLENAAIAVWLDGGWGSMHLFRRKPARIKMWTSS